MKQKPSVRPAKPADAAAVAAISSSRREAAGWPAAEFASEIGRADSIFLVADNGEVFGYLIARVAPDEAQIVDVAVKKDGTGAGRALLEAFFELAAARGLGRAVLEVSERNARAQDFYIAAGFRVVGRRPKFYNQGTDAVLMERALA